MYPAIAASSHPYIRLSQTIAAAAQKLHEMGLSHGQLFSGEEHHILYDLAQKMVMIVDFTVSAAG
jgi:predicted Ser/Thr protein kinase